MLKGRRSCHLPRVGGRRKGADGADDARRREELEEEGGHVYVYVSWTGGTFGMISWAESAVECTCACRMKASLNQGR